MGALALFFYNQIDENIKDERLAYIEAREKGLETSALIVNKYQTGTAGRGSSINNFVNLFSEDEMFTKRVPSSIYKQLDEGDFIKVVVTMNDIYLGSKMNDTESIQVLTKEEVKQMHQNK